MIANEHASASAGISSHSERRPPGRLMRTVRKGVRLSVYGILVLFRPLAIPILAWVAVGGLGIWALFVLVAHDSEFPSLRVLGMSLGCALACVLYHAAMEWLVPGSQRSGR